MDQSVGDRNSDQSDDAVLIESSDSEYNETDSWKPMEEYEYKLQKLLKTTFARPFYFQLSNCFGAQIFPASWDDPEAPNCLSEVQAWHLKLQDPTFEALVKKSISVLKNHSEFYQANPAETHDENYSSDELVCLADHLLKKMNKLKPEMNVDPVNNVYEKLKEMFPETDTMILLAKSKKHVSNDNGMGEYQNLTEVINDLLSTSPK